MPQCACADDTVFVCVCLCRLLARINKVQVRVSNGLLVMFSFVDLQIMLGSQSYAYSFALYLECQCSVFKRVCRKTCPWSIATVYLVVED